MADLKNTFSKGLTVLNVKTATFLESNKIKTYIATLKNEIESLKSDIGRIIYEEWTATGAVSTPNVEEKLNMIRAKEEEIRAQEGQAEQLVEKEKQILGVQESAKEVLQEGAAVAVTCPNCGQTYERSVNFCKKCGTKMG